MEMGLLWGTFVFLLLASAGIIVWELGKPPGEYKVILLFLENSEEVCEEALRRICFRARYCSGGARVLVVDDCSRDATVPIVNRMAAMFPEIDLLLRKGEQKPTFGQIRALLCSPLAAFDLRDSRDLRSCS